VLTGVIAKLRVALLFPLVSLGPYRDGIILFWVVGCAVGWVRTYGASIRQSVYGGATAHQELGRRH